MFVLVIMYFTGTAHIEQFSTREQCQGQLLERVDSGAYKTMKSAECLPLLED